ncbi:unnamed protein product [Prunus armeniaca]|uniref:Uncharacterized protein n=1 Tax=Prunus armeniaca TaxID=36596 RepID=A0A6J5U316_PRUAR|nr:unnamed protein product [Prunus armeniaca]CAB4300950.1 unnamed protein product [Prunus armeniaca]
MCQNQRKVVLAAAPNRPLLMLSLRFLYTNPPNPINPAPISTPNTIPAFCPPLSPPEDPFLLGGGGDGGGGGGDGGDGGEGDSGGL